MLQAQDGGFTRAGPTGAEQSGAGKEVIHRVISRVAMLEMIARVPVFVRTG